MKLTITRFGAFAIALGMVGLSQATAVAQFGSGGGFEGDPKYQSSESGGLFPGQEDGGLDPFQLLHRSRLKPSRSLDEFATDGNGQIDEAGAEFRRRQLEQLNCTDAAPPATCAPTQPQ